ncbi:uncharacterized protein LOC135499460 [Lineus longissimus]|uniref:uncharacterized protein LOC135499460 n=1 Tax=Lineus longissimus TaxID=88925 RepID=UPI002B4C6DC9
MDLDNGTQTKGSSSSLNKIKKSTATTPNEERVQHIGNDLCKIDDYKIVYTKAADNLKRRAIVLVKENNTWGFTLQTYGIHHKATKEVEMLTYVDYVAFDGPAHKAGMRAGDVILSINGESMENVNHPSLVDHIMKCNDKIRMVVFFEDCVRKVEMHQRIIKLQKVLENKEKEFLALEEQERKIIEGIHLESSSSEYETDEDEDETHRSNISIEVTPPEALIESPARRASMLGNQFVQMFAPDSCALTDVGAVSPRPERFRASPSFGRRFLRRQAPLERDYKTSQDFQKISPCLVRKERGFQPISSSDDESGDDSKEKSESQKGLMKDIAKGNIKIVPKADVNIVAKVKMENHKVTGNESKQAAGETVSHVDSIDDSGLHVVVNKKAAAVLGLCDMTPESQKVRKRSSSGSHDPSPVLEQGEGQGQSSSPKPAPEIKAGGCETDLTIGKKAARFLGLCEPELESKKPQRSHSANEKDMVRPSSEIFALRNEEKDVSRPKSQFFIALPGGDDDAVFREIEYQESQRRRSSQFYISLDEIEGDAQDSSSSSYAKLRDSNAVDSLVAKTEGQEGGNEHLIGGAVRGDFTKVKSGAKSRPGVLVYHYNTRPANILQIGKSSSLGDLYPMDKNSETHAKRHELKFIRSQSEAVEIGYSYGSLGRKRHHRKKPKSGALVHSQSVSSDVPQIMKDKVVPHSASSPVVQQAGFSKLHSEHSALGIVSEKKVELGEAVIGPELKSSGSVYSGMQGQKTMRSSPRSITPTPLGTALTRNAPWGEGELEKVVTQKLRHDSAGVVLDETKIKKQATSHAVGGLEKEHEVRTKSESNLGKKSRKNQGMYVVATGDGFSKADLEIPVFQDESQDVKLVRYEPVSEQMQNSIESSTDDIKIKKHKSRKQDRSVRSALETEKLNESRARSPAVLVAQRNVDKANTGCERVQDNESESTNIPKVHSLAVQTGDHKSASKDNEPGSLVSTASDSVLEGPESKQEIVNISSFQQNEVPQSSVIFEESKAQKYSFDGTCIRLGELINEDDEITWL